MAEYINHGDNYWDEQHSGFDENGKRIPHQERYEFMIGYPDDSPQMTKSRSSDLDSILLASLSASICSLVATTII